MQLTASITVSNGDKYYREMPCFIQSSGVISAVLSAWASCTPVQSHLHESQYFRKL